MTSLYEINEKLSERDQRILLEMAKLLLKESLNEDDSWITVKEAAKLLRVSSPFVRRKIDEGVFRAQNIGERKTRVLRSDVDNLLQNKS